MASAPTSKLSDRESTGTLGKEAGRSPSNTLPIGVGDQDHEFAGTPTSSTPRIVRIEPPSGWLDLRLSEVWEYRELLYFFVWRDLKVRYKQTVIGVAWVILQPLLTMGVFTIFFGRLAKLPSQGLPYPVFYFAALVPWAYFSQALISCTNVVVDNQNIITKVYFPRLILPLTAVCSGLMDFAIGFAADVVELVERLDHARAGFAPVVGPE